jgi:hypothetical protein
MEDHHAAQLQGLRKGLYAFKNIVVSGAGTGIGSAAGCGAAGPRGSLFSPAAEAAADPQPLAGRELEALLGEDLKRPGPITGLAVALRLSRR